MIERKFLNQITEYLRELSLPPRYLYYRLPDAAAPCRKLLCKVSTRSERRFINELFDMGLYPKVWSPSEVKL